MTVDAQKTMRLRNTVPVIPLRVQVAAVCYRRRGPEIEFLLVRTSSGRWIFPKGHADESLSKCEAAAREAWEEAGAIGEIEPRCFQTFRYWKQDSGDEILLVEAYLLEVLRRRVPEEDYRAPTWFTPFAAIRAVAEGRDTESSTELVGVIDAALRNLTNTEAQEYAHARASAARWRRSGISRSR
ncbi:MAG: NUDIX domain-containing protein [Acidobacteriia bacterium]|nr:NUDIX domain-containing protein [Terriglobia bacterium]